MRLFVGIPLGESVARELSKLTEQLKGSLGGLNRNELKWSAEAGWHITLQFLGKTTEPQYVCVVSGLRRIVTPPFSIQLDPPGFFQRVGVFFAAVRVSEELLGLQQRVTAATGPCGFESEERPYHPHITLARSKGGRGGLRELQARLPEGMEFSGFVPREFLLYESFPGPGGSRYEVRERFPLQASREQ